MANAAWLARAVMAHNLGRAAGQLAGADEFTVPGRLVHTGRQRRLRVPAAWPWVDAIASALERIHTVPLRC